MRVLAGQEEKWELRPGLVWKFKVFQENKDCSVCQSVAQYFLSDDPPCQLRHCEISIQAFGSPPRISFFPVSLHSLFSADSMLTILRHAQLESTMKTTPLKCVQSTMSISSLFHRAYLHLRMSTLFLLTIIGSMWNESGAGPNIAISIMPDLVTRCPTGRIYPGLNI
jgi:hypothetical protein